MNSSQKVLALMLAILLILANSAAGIACGPVLSSRIHLNGLHPDLPLRQFAAGNFGIVQSGWAKSYLTVCYRYLSARPLAYDEQSGILRLWHKRLNGSYDVHALDLSLERWMKARKRIMKNACAEPEIYRESTDFASVPGLTRSSLETAYNTLRDRCHRFGAESPEVREWLLAQDMVFAPSLNRIPKELPAGSDKLCMADRKYQIAAAYFYRQDFDKAAKLFGKIAEDSESPWRSLSLYLVARCKVDKASSGGMPADRSEAQRYIKNLLARKNTGVNRLDLLDLARSCNHATGSQPFGEMVESVASKYDEQFAADVEDLTYIIMSGTYCSPESEDQDFKQVKDELRLEQHDLTDWLMTVHPGSHNFDRYSRCSEKERIKSNLLRKKLALHSIKKWRQTHSTPWLVAALLYNDLHLPVNRDLRIAAARIKSDSRAFHTASFYFLDALIREGRDEEARLRLDSILKHDRDLPTTTLNIFLTQRMAASDNTWDYLKHSVQSTATFLFAYTDLYNLELEDDWKIQECQTKFTFFAHPVIDSLTAADLNTNLPMSYWYEFARRKGLPPPLQGEIVSAAWVRAHLLGKREMADSLESELRKCHPEYATFLNAYDHASNYREKQFIVACLILHQRKMGPFIPVRAGCYMNDVEYWSAKEPPEFPKPNKDGEYDWQDDVWTEYSGDVHLTDMLERYIFSGGVNKVLSSEEKASAKREREVLNRELGFLYLGKLVLERAKSHPDDPRLPEALYNLTDVPNHLPEAKESQAFACSRAAFRLLRGRYKHTAWSGKAQAGIEGSCWH